MEGLESLRKNAEELTRRGWGLAVSLLRNADDASDAVQQAFLVAARKPHAVPTDDCWPWFAQVVALEVSNLRQKRGRMPVALEGDDTMDSAQGPEERLAQHEFSAELAVALKELPQAEHDALMLTQYGGLSYEAAAKSMRMPLGTFNHQVRRGLQRLRARFGVEDSAVTRSLAVMPMLAVPDSLLPKTLKIVAEANAVAAGSAGLVVAGVIVNVKLLTAVASFFVLLILLFLLGPLVGLRLWQAPQNLLAVQGNSAEFPGMPRTDANKPRRDAGDSIAAKTTREGIDVPGKQPLPVPTPDERDEPVPTPSPDEQIDVDSIPPAEPGPDFETPKDIVDPNLVATLTGVRPWRNPSQLNGMLVSPDGAFYVTASEFARYLRWCDAATGQITREVVPAREFSLGAISRNSVMLACSMHRNDHSKDIRIYRNDTAELVGAVCCHGSPGPMAFSADHRRLYCLTWQREQCWLLDWNLGAGSKPSYTPVKLPVEDGQEPRHFSPQWMSLSADGSRLRLAGTGDSGLEVLDYSLPALQVSAFTEVALEDTYRLTGIVVHADSPLVAVARSGSRPPDDEEWQGATSIYDLRTAKIVRQLMTWRVSTQMALAPNGKTLFATNWDGASLFDIETGQLIRELSPGHDLGQPYRDPQFTAAGDAVFAWVFNRNWVSRWSVEDGRLMSTSPSVGSGWEHTSYLTAITFAAGDSALVTCDVKGRLIVWDVASQRGRFVVETGIDSSDPLVRPLDHSTFAIDPHGKFLVTRSSGQSPSLNWWDLSTGVKIRSIPLQADGRIFISANGNILALVKGPDATDLFAAGSGEFLRSVAAAKDNLPKGVFGTAALAADASCLIWAVGIDKKESSFWRQSLADGTFTHRVAVDPNDHDTFPLGQRIVIAGDGKMFTLLGNSRKIGVFRADTLEAIGSIQVTLPAGTDSKPQEFWFDPNFSVSTDGSVVLSRENRISAATGEILQQFKGVYAQSVTSSAFSADGKLIATGSFHGNLHIWRVADDQPKDK